MENKYNESTKLRPEGDRIVDAPFVHIDIPAFMQQIKSEKTWQTSDRNAITVFKTDEMRIVLIAMHPNAVMEEHSTEGIISVQVLEGEIEFSTPRQSVNLKEKEIITLHSGIPHTVKAMRESVFLLTLNPTSEFRNDTSVLY